MPLKSNTQQQQRQKFAVGEWKTLKRNLKQQITRQSSVFMSSGFVKIYTSCVESRRSIVTVFAREFTLYRVSEAGCCWLVHSGSQQQHEGERESEKRRKCWMFFRCFVVQCLSCFGAFSKKFHRLCFSWCFVVVAVNCVSSELEPQKSWG